MEGLMSMAQDRYGARDKGFLSVLQMAAGDMPYMFNRLSCTSTDTTTHSRMSDLSRSRVSSYRSNRSFRTSSYQNSFRRRFSRGNNADVFDAEQSSTRRTVTVTTSGDESGSRTGGDRRSSSCQDLSISSSVNLQKELIREQHMRYLQMLARASDLRVARFVRQLSLKPPHANEEEIERYIDACLHEITTPTDVPSKFCSLYNDSVLLHCSVVKALSELYQYEYSKL